ncbi:YuzD family protein [Halobacillus litoralis]|uniref:YuzD family protein n=1 Tax=Halobacillus litoralis TaxID=45668 RepID=UPI001372048F|nr:YuzD family protein [Halobacillus litoralis]MYL38510.1 DUF1462 family protein [Halobacillus litoralis]
MNQPVIRVYVYGAEVKCASCVNAPGSKETFEWLEAALTRKYGEKSLQFTYYDIHTENQEGVDMAIVQQLLDDELFYPLVLVEERIVAEGNPRLKAICKSLEEHGLQQVSNS